MAKGIARWAKTEGAVVAGAAEDAVVVSARSAAAR
jgi:hypothetical protein